MKITKNNIILMIVFVLIIGTILYFEKSNPKIVDNLESHDIKIESVSEVDLKRVELKSQKYEIAKEIAFPDGYVNIDNITISELVGKKIILIDFWTYSCINCQRTFPYLNSWYEKYKDEGFVIVGIHTPEFDFEKKRENVVEATKKWNISYPVVQDNRYQTWSAYKNRYWPRKYLIDIDGFIVYDHIGEGGYLETEKKILELLNERNMVLGIDEEINMSLGGLIVESPEFNKIRTPELYFGHAFQSDELGNPEVAWTLDVEVNYSLPKILEKNKLYLGGEWIASRDYMKVLSPEGKIILKYNAKNVNLVMGAMENKKVRAFLDDDEINSIDVLDFDLYNVIKGIDYGDHKLELIIPEGVRIYAFTFG